MVPADRPPLLFASELNLIEYVLGPPFAEGIEDRDEGPALRRERVHNLRRHYGLRGYQPARERDVTTGVKKCRNNPLFYLFASFRIQITSHAAQSPLSSPIPATGTPFCTWTMARRASGRGLHGRGSERAAALRPVF